MTYISRRSRYIVFHGPMTLLKGKTPESLKSVSIGTPKTDQDDSDDEVHGMTEKVRAAER